MLFLVGRLFLAIRSFYAKRAYCKFHHSAAPPRPPESEALFNNFFPPQKHRFQKFPEPTLLTLDAIFDSGLRDMDFHGMGPLGTLDLHNLTEMAYLLPLAAIATGERYKSWEGGDCAACGMGRVVRLACIEITATHIRCSNAACSKDTRFST